MKKYLLLELDTEGHDEDIDWEVEVKEALWNGTPLATSEVSTADVTQYIYGAFDETSVWLYAADERFNDPGVRIELS